MDPFPTSQFGFVYILYYDARVRRQQVFDQCLQHRAPQYMADCCIHTSDIACRQHVQSAGCQSAVRTVEPYGVACLVIGHFLWLAQRSGTYYQTTCEICHITLTVFARTWKLLLLILLVYTVHQRLCCYALYKSTIDFDFRQMRLSVMTYYTLIWADWARQSTDLVCSCITQKIIKDWTGHPFWGWMHLSYAILSLYTALCAVPA